MGAAGQETAADDRIRRLMTQVQRTMLKSPPELWPVLDDEALLLEWLRELTGVEEIDAIEVREREAERRLVVEPVSSDGFRGARIGVSLQENGFGTRVCVETEFHAGGFLPGARERAEAEAETRIEALLDRAFEEIATPKRRPFTAA